MNKTRTGKTVRYKPDIGSPLSANERAELSRLKKRTVDFSDIPASADHAEWTHPGALVSENKQQVTLRLDRDVLEFFRHTGKRYQTRINNVLRAYMQAHVK